MGRAGCREQGGLFQLGLVIPWPRVGPAYGSSRCCPFLETGLIYHALLEMGGDEWEFGGTVQGPAPHDTLVRTFSPSNLHGVGFGLGDKLWVSS